MAPKAQEMLKKPSYHWLIELQGFTFTEPCPATPPVSSAVDVLPSPTSTDVSLKHGPEQSEVFERTLPASQDIFTLPVKRLLTEEHGKYHSEPDGTGCPEPFLLSWSVVIDPPSKVSVVADEAGQESGVHVIPESDTLPSSHPNDTAPL
jgi:hypothetical protein